MAKKIHTHEQLKEIANKDVFPFNPNANKLIACSDGSFFLPSAKNNALDHAKRNGLKTYEVDRPDAKTSKEEKEMKKLISKIEKCQTVQDIDDLVNKHESREEVLLAIRATKKKLQAEAVAEDMKAKAEEQLQEDQSGNKADDQEPEVEGSAVPETIDGLTKSQWADQTVEQVGERVKNISDSEQLNTLLVWVDTKGGDAHIQARIEELAAEAKTKNPDTNHQAK